jgi:hypothetical protein
VVSLAYHNVPAEGKMFMVSNVTKSADGSLVGTVVDALVYTDAMFSRDMPRLHAFLVEKLGVWAVCFHPDVR